MDNGYDIILFLIFVVLLQKELHVRAQITVGPSNNVAVIGEQVKLNCTANAAIGFWYLSTNGTTADQMIIAGPGCSVALNPPTLTMHYAVESMGGGTTCNLIVSNITMAQAGVYRCFDGTNQVFSTLTVTESSLIVTNNSTENVIVENDNVIITCTLSYNGSVSPAPILRPYFRWTNIGGHQVNSSYDSTKENQAVSQISITAGRENITPYTCHVYLQLNPSTNPSYATNTPTINKSSTSPTIEVLYYVTTPYITKDSGESCESIVLTCNSFGNPPPNYTWFYWNTTDKNVKSETKTMTLSLDEVNRNYSCEAYNTIPNVTYTATYTWTASKTDLTSKCNSNPADITDDQLRTILLAAILGGYGLLNIIAMIVFLIIYYSRKSNKSKLNTRFSWLQNMLPCMNETRENVGCKFISVILFIVMSILVGIIVFPILVAVANCSRRSSVSIGNSDIGMGDAAYANDISPDSKAAGNPSTAAHGDVGDHYDVIRNTKHIADDYTDATSNGTKKLVPYTCVQPNGSSADDVDRYYVSLPDTIEKS